MHNKNRELFNADLKTNVSAEDLVLMPPTELFDEAKAIALRTKSDEKYPFFLQYDSNQKGFLLSLLQTSGAIVEGDDEKGHTLATSMNMAQLAFIKRLDCVERVKTDEGINSFLIEEAVKPEPIRTNPPKSGTTATGQAAEAEQTTQTTAFTVGDFAMSATNADVISGEEEPVDGTAVASVAASPRSSSCGCPTNTDMASAQEISVETLVSGCICCPGTTQWFKFTAPQTKRYTIFTSGSLDTVGTLSGSCLSEPITNDDCAGKINFRIIENLCAGSTYYIQVGAKNDATGSYTLQVTAQILAEKVTVSSTNENGVIVLEQGKTYELPRGEGFGFFNIPNTVNAPVSVDVAPDDTTDKRVYWYASSISNNTVSTDFDFYDGTTKY